MADVTTTVHNYIAAWNETDPQLRRAIISQTWADDGTYVDPVMSGTDPDAIDAMIAAAQAQFAGHRFVLAGDPDTHNEAVRFTWRLHPAEGGEAVAAGQDFATLAPDGRLRAVTGFLER